MRLYHLIVGSQWTDTCNEYVRIPYDDHMYVQVHNYVLVIINGICGRSYLGRSQAFRRVVRPGGPGRSTCKVAPGHPRIASSQIRLLTTSFDCNIRV